MSEFIDEVTGYPVDTSRRGALALAQQICGDLTIDDRDPKKILAVALTDLFVDFQRLQDRRANDGLGLSDWR